MLCLIKNTLGLVARLLAALACLQLSTAAHANTDRLAGMTKIGSDKPELAIVLFPGADLSAERYVLLAKAIHDSLGEGAAVLIADSWTKIATPIEARGRLQSVLNLMKQNYSDAEARSRIFVAGHSLAGITTNGLVPSMQLGGMILLGSYLPQTIVIGKSLEDYARPVLTLGGEFDGLTGINYLARDVQALQRLAGQDPDTLRTKPVIILPGVNHMQFADGSALDGDFSPALSLDEAHSAMAQAISDFVVLNSDHAAGQKSLSAQRQSAAFRASVALVRPYLATNGVEASWCEQAQVKAAALKPGAFERIGFDTKTYRGALGQAGFVFDKAQVYGDSDTFVLHLPVFIQDSFGPLDISRDHALSPSSFWCKMRSSEALAIDTKKEVSGEAPASCGELNLWAIREALALISTEARSRLSAKYGPIESWKIIKGGDASTSLVEYGPLVIRSQTSSTGQSWVGSKFNFTKKRGAWTLDTYELKSAVDTWPERFAGAHYCKIISPGRVVEWATLLGLK